MSQPDAPTPSANRAAAATCNPADPRQNPDLIIWQRWPDLPDDSIRVGSLKPDCSRTLDSWTDDEPTGPGHCSKIAWGYDNPNYPYGERPAPPLKHVIDTVGDCS